MKILDFELSQFIELVYKEEIAQGNRIAESHKGWRDKESTLIILEKPFCKKYDIDNLEYHFINDPHYWKEEYRDNNKMQTLACRF